MKSYIIFILAFAILAESIICIKAAEEDENSNETLNENEETNSNENPNENENVNSNENGNENPEPTDATSFCEQNPKWGFQCDGCTKKVQCIKSGKNWIGIDLGTCEGNVFCSRSEKNCSTIKDCDEPVPEVDFVCTSEGVFPNPYDCKNYYICGMSEGSTTLTKTKVNCPDSYAFNPSANVCNEKTSNSELCGKKQFQCEEDFHMAAWPTNKNIYYLCRKKVDGEKETLYPELYLCEPDTIFDDAQQQCVDEGAIVPTTTSNNVTESTSEGTTVSSPPVDKCTSSGIFEDPSNCHGYIYCTPQLQRITKVCPSNSHFDKNMKACVLGAEC